MNIIFTEKNLIARTEGLTFAYFIKVLDVFVDVIVSTLANGLRASDDVGASDFRRRGVVVVLKGNMNGLSLSTHNIVYKGQRENLSRGVQKNFPKNV